MNQRYLNVVNYKHRHAHTHTRTHTHTHTYTHTHIHNIYPIFTEAINIVLTYLPEYKPGILIFGIQLVYLVTYPPILTVCCLLIYGQYIRFVISLETNITMSELYLKYLGLFINTTTCMLREASKMGWRALIVPCNHALIYSLTQWLTHSLTHTISHLSVQSNLLFLAQWK